MFGMGGSLRLVWKMAFFRLEAKIIGREKRGRSVIAAAAYRAGTKIRDELRGKIFDYTRRVKGVVQTATLAPDGAPEWVADPGKLWNSVEAGEKRKDAQLAREYILAVPPELSADAQFQTALDWAKKELVASGMVAEVFLHHTRSGNNPHVHILTTMRKMEGDKFSAKKAIEWNDVKLLKQQRRSWADTVNAALEAAGRPERVDHRSLRDQGLDRLPQPKIGPEATAMKRKGLVEDPERFQEVRYVKTLNEVMPMVRSIERQGEIHQIGLGNTWWEKSIVFMSRVRERAIGVAKASWQKLLDAGRAKEERKGPDRSV
jgi:ATP-dependent exoDNAse (exonuclease V) alpha subunit